MIAKNWPPIELVKLSNVFVVRETFFLGISILPVGRKTFFLSSTSKSKSLNNPDQKLSLIELGYCKRFYILLNYILFIKRAINV